MKVCFKCKIEKEDSCFYKDKRAISGLKTRCIVCEKNYIKEYLKDKKEINSAYKKKYRDNNRDKINKKHSEVHYHKYKDKINERNKRWRKENIERVRFNSRAIYKVKAENPEFRFQRALRNRVRIAFKRKSWIKGCGTELLIGTSFEIAKSHIEKLFKNGMMWENYGEWHVDHIIPISSAKTKEEMINLCHYTNLQPLWAFDNISKSNKIINPIQTILII